MRRLILPAVFILVPACGSPPPKPDPAIEQLADAIRQRLKLCGERATTRLNLGQPADEPEFDQLELDGVDAMAAELKRHADFAHLDPQFAREVITAQIKATNALALQISASRPPTAILEATKEKEQRLRSITERIIDQDFLVVMALLRLQPENAPEVREQIATRVATVLNDVDPTVRELALQPFVNAR